MSVSERVRSSMMIIQRATALKMFLVFSGMTDHFSWDDSLTARAFLSLKTAVNFSSCIPVH